MKKARTKIVTPVYNDWTSATKLIKEIGTTLANSGVHNEVEFIFVDDGSTEPIPALESLAKDGFEVTVLPLTSNVGHQLAIMAGLRYVKNEEFNQVIVMDSDGEDTAEGVIKLLAESDSRPEAVVVAQRGVRSEKLAFRLMYNVHKLIFRTLIGKRLDFGNFVLLPKSAVTKIINLADSASHLPSSILRSGLPIIRIRVDRGLRFFGESKMNFEKLVSHSFASLAVFSDQIMVRLMILSFFTTLVTTVGIFAVVVTRVFSDIATPGWATAAVGLLLVISFQVLSFVGLGTLITLNLNSLKNFYRAQADGSQTIKVMKVRK